MTTEQLKEKAENLRRLHSPGRPLVLANAWDVASAQLVEAAGFPAVATSSGAIAAALGHPDDDCMPTKEAFAAIERIAGAVTVPVTGDIEAGYRLTAEELVDTLLASGAVGCNIEDSDHHTESELTPVDTQAAYLEAMRSASSSHGVNLVINARVDVSKSELLEDGVERATAYVAAGADCVYPIRLKDEDLIGEFIQKVQAPVNIMLRPDGPSVGRLAELGVARISLAGGLMKHAYTAAHEKLKELGRELARLP